MLTKAWQIPLALAIWTVVSGALAQEPYPPSFQPDPGPSSLRGPDLAAMPAPVVAGPLTESSWYVRADYYHWNERLDGGDFVNEEGLLTTLGYVHRHGPERFRFELFGGSVHYRGEAMFDGGGTEPLSSSTDLLGVRGEYDLLIEPEALPYVSFFVGLGTRFWVRDLQDGLSDISQSLVFGYQESWWTIYPYLGLERRRTFGDGAEFYASGRIGMTAITYQHVSYFDVALYPKLGLTGQLEAGVRSRRLFAAGFFETFSWSESSERQELLQPRSTLFTAGLKTGVCF